jgi:exopolysaccharide biosynthesis polyprenyl glycosylphosphotransferase
MFRYQIYLLYPSGQTLEPSHFLYLWLTIDRRKWFAAHKADNERASKQMPSEGEHPMNIPIPNAIRAACTYANNARGETPAQAAFEANDGRMFMLPGAHLLVPRAAGQFRVVADALRHLRDVVVSLCLLTLALPLMLVVACLIKVDSPGPVLYRQDRVGRLGRVFNLLKFRSMRLDAEADGPSWAAQRDHRVTRVGRFIRASRIDELPQLINVLRGEMSVVGPRPERPYFTEKLTPVIPGYHERTRVRPGITGLAQVSYRYGASVEDARNKHTYDMYYLRNRTMLLDLYIMLATVWVVVFRIGAR